MIESAAHAVGPHVLARVRLALLGALAPRAASFVFPPEVLPSAGLLAQLGVVLFMFLVGVELDDARHRAAPGRARPRRRRAALVSPPVPR